MYLRSSLSGSLQSFESDGSWREILLRAVAELLGSAIFVYIGCMGCVGSLAGPANHLQVAVTFGLIVTAIVQIIGHISDCHTNPMVSVCSMMLGARSPITCGVYILAHFLGAIIGYGMLRVITPSELLHNGNPETVSSFCVTALNEHISVIQGLLIETCATGILIFFVCACADPRVGNSDSKAIKFGFAIIALTLVTGPYTGCGMNPARSFAPALWNREWTNHWVYWVGPISGTVMSTSLYKMLFWPKQQPEEDIPDAAVLKSIEIQKSEAITAHALTTKNDFMGDHPWASRVILIPTISDGVIHCQSYTSFVLPEENSSQL